MNREQIINQYISVYEGHAMEKEELEIMLNGFADDIMNNLQFSLPDNLNKAAEKVIPNSYVCIELDTYGGLEPVYSREQMLTMFEKGAEWALQHKE